jgi:hypothetical protein
MKQSPEFGKFNKFIDTLFSVPHKKLQGKLEGEGKANKERCKRRTKTTPPHRASGA